MVSRCHDQGCIGQQLAGWQLEDGEQPKDLVLGAVELLVVLGARSDIHGLLSGALGLVELGVADNLVRGGGGALLYRCQLSFKFERKRARPTLTFWVSDLRDSGTIFSLRVSVAVLRL